MMSIFPIAGIMASLLCTVVLTVPVNAAGSYDGTYAGKYSLTSSHNSRCGPGWRAVMVVAEDWAKIAFALRVESARVSAGGAFETVFGGTKGYGGSTTINGQITDNRMRFDWVNPQYCSYRFEGRKQ